MPREPPDDDFERDEIEDDHDESDAPGKRVFFREVIDRFILARAHEGKNSTAYTVVERLRSEADALYRTADSLEATGTYYVDPIECRLPFIRRRLLKGLSEEVVAEHWLAEVAEDFDAAGTDETDPATFRKRAIAIARVADRAWAFYLDHGDRTAALRISRQKDKKRFGARGSIPSLAMADLLTVMKKNHITDREMAEHLVRAGYEPEIITSSEPDPVRRWITIFKGARNR